MLVEAKYPTRFDARKYDEYLEKGFFRGASIMYKTQLLCIGSKVSSVINIRLPIKNFEISKSKKRVLKGVEKNFTVKVQPYYVNKQHDLLYKKFKKKFKGFLYPDVESFLSLGSPFALAIFNTHLLEIYDGDKLIAFSLFDFGYKSCAGLLAIYDFDYNKYSLGNYTMFKEIEIAKHEDIDYYYPGYVLNNTNDFDYKLRIGKVESLDWNNGWSLKENIKKGDFLSDKIWLKMREAKKHIEGLGLNYKLYFYPNFSLGYLMEISSIFNFPVYIQIFNTQLGGDIYLFYDHFKDDFVLGRFNLVSLFPKSEKLEVSEEYENSVDLDLDIKECTEEIIRCKNVTEIFSSNY